MGKGRVILSVYRLIHNFPKYITSTEYSQGMSRGDDSEAFNALMDCGELPKSYYNLSRCEWRGPGYYCQDVEDKGVRIYGLY